ASDCIEEQSTAQRDYLRNGFTALGDADERRCTGIEVHQLVGIEDVTAQLQGATRDLPPDEWNRALKAEMSRLEKACGDGSRVRCEVVTLYRGGRYHLYKYKRYQDVRLVFAPEAQMAAFGGDPDNFRYPRYALDLAFLRAYDNNQPAHTQDFFKW